MPSRIQFTLDVTPGGHQMALDVDSEAAEVAARCVEGEQSTVTELTCRVVTPRPGLARALPVADADYDVNIDGGPCPACGNSDPDEYACAECAPAELLALEVG